VAFASWIVFAVVLTAITLTTSELWKRRARKNAESQTNGRDMKMYIDVGDEQSTLTRAIPSLMSGALSSPKFTGSMQAPPKNTAARSQSIRLTNSTTRSSWFSTLFFWRGKKDSTPEDGREVYRFKPLIKNPRRRPSGI
jgi:hypothetical protein